jgi:hypothetical protein
MNKYSLDHNYIIIIIFAGSFLCLEFLNLLEGRGGIKIVNWIEVEG